MSYESLAKLIEPYINDSYDSIPEELRERISAVPFLASFWYEVTTEKRLSMAQDHDRNSDPAMAAENEHWSQLSCKVDHCKREIKKWEAMHPQSITEATLKETKLSALNIELAMLRQQYHVPYGDTAPAQTATPAPVVVASDAMPDPERRLTALRALGGSAKYKDGRLKFTGIEKLVQSERGRPRCSVKTIRNDLKEAEQAERDAKSAVYCSGLGQR